MIPNWGKLTAATVAVAMSLFGGEAEVFAATAVVTTTSATGWLGLNEGPSGSLGSVTFAPGLGTPLSGDGSAVLEVDDSGRSSFGTTKYQGTSLASLTQLTFDSYSSSAGTLAAISLQFDVDYDDTDASSAYQGRLVFQPSAAPTPDVWQSQNALTGVWWASQAPGNAVCPQSAPCTWAQMLSAFPNAAIREDSIYGGSLLFRLGGPIPGGAIAAVDNFTIGGGFELDIYDFEPGASVTPSLASAESIVEIQAYGFRALRNVRVFYYTNNLRRKRVKICRAKAGLAGSFYCTVAIPAEPDSGPFGVHQLRIRGPRRIEYYVPFVLVP